MRKEQIYYYKGSGKEYGDEKNKPMQSKTMDMNHICRVLETNGNGQVYFWI